MSEFCFSVFLFFLALCRDPLLNCAVFFWFDGVAFQILLFFKICFLLFGFIYLFWILTFLDVANSFV